MNQLTVLTNNNKRVLTTKQLAQVYETEEIRIQQALQRNESRFIEGKHYYLLKGDVLKDFKANYLNDSNLINKFAPSLILWTEKGANRMCKILDTDKAWEQFEILEDTYFNVKDIIKPDSYMIDDPIKRAKRWIEEQEERNKLALENKKVKEERDTLEAIINRLTKGCKGAMKVREAAKRLSNEGYIIGQNELYNKMRDWKMIITRINPKSGQRCGTEPFQSAINNGWLQVVMIEKNDKVFPQTLVTPKGLIYMFKKIIRETCGASI